MTYLMIAAVALVVLLIAALVVSSALCRRATHSLRFAEPSPGQPGLGDQVHGARLEGQTSARLTRDLPAAPPPGARFTAVGPPLRPRAVDRLRTPAQTTKTSGGGGHTRG